MMSSIPFTMNLRSSANKQHDVMITHHLTTIHGRRAVKIFTKSIHGTGSMTLFLSPRPSPKLRLGRVAPREQFTKGATPPCLLHHSLPAEDEKSIEWTNNSHTESDMLGVQMTSINDLADRLVAAADDKTDVDPAENDIQMASNEMNARTKVDVKMEDVHDEQVDVEMR